MTLASWSNFFLGELSAAAALAGLLFVSISVNQARILALGRMADRGLEALAMLLLVVVVASLPLIPGQLVRMLGAEIFGSGLIALLALIPVQRAYLSQTDTDHRRMTFRMVIVNRLAMAMIAFAGVFVFARNDTMGLYLLAPGILISFAAVGANAWVLLIEINR